jgi:hypothetical protein
MKKTQMLVFLQLLLIAVVISLLSIILVKKTANKKFENSQKIVGFFLMGTGKYLKLVEQLISSMEENFCVKNNQIYVNYFIFTDNKIWTPNNIKQSLHKYKIIYRKSQNWTMNTLLRFEMILNEYEHLNLNSYDYLYWLDADMKMVDKICEDIFGDRVGTMHADYHTSEKAYPYESRYKMSRAFVDQKHRYEHPYYVGSFFGGSQKEMKSLMKKCLENIQYDLKELNFIARVQDESHLNR